MDYYEYLWGLLKYWLPLTLFVISLTIDRDGKIAHVYPKVSPKEHAVEVLKKMKELKMVS